MMYFDKETCRAYLPEQVSSFNEKRRKALKEIDNSLWLNIVTQANKEQKEIVAGTDGLPVLKERSADNESPAAELKSLRQYLSDTNDLVLECYEQGLTLNESYPEIAEKRLQARARIKELEAKQTEES